MGRRRFSPFRFFPTRRQCRRHPRPPPRNSGQVAPLSLRSGQPPLTPPTALSRKFGKVSLRYRFALVPPSSPTATLNRKFGKVSLRYRVAPYRPRPQPPARIWEFRKTSLRETPHWATTINPLQPPCVENSERCRSAIASLRTTIVPNRHPQSRVRKGVAPLPLRFVPPSSPPPP